MHLKHFRLKTSKFLASWTVVIILSYSLVFYSDYEVYATEIHANTN